MRSAREQLEAILDLARARPEDRVPEGHVEITFGRWIPGSRGRRPPRQRS